MRVFIEMFLNEDGQKASLLAGGDGQAKQEIVVQRDHPLYAAVVAAAKIHQRTGGESVCVLKVDRTWDHVLTVQDALDAPALLEAERFASVTRIRSRC